MKKNALAYALAGLSQAFRREHHFKVHLSASLLALLACWTFRVRPWEWLAVGTVIVLVLMAELFNTALEAVVDLVSPERHPLAALAKDIAAGAVLLAALLSLAVGGVVFLPRLLVLLGFR